MMNSTFGERYVKSGRKIHRGVMPMWCLKCPTYRLESGLWHNLPVCAVEIVLAAVHSEPKAVDQFRFFWRELKLIGARVYELEYFEDAFAPAAAGTLPLKKMIT